MANVLSGIGVMGDEALRRILAGLRGSRTVV